MSLHRALLLALLAIASACNSEDSGNSSDASPATPTGPRGVLLLSLDNLAADHLPTYGYSRLTAPGLQRWFDESSVFERCITAANWTLPSHMSMLTGVRPRRHGVIDHSRQDPQVPLISQILSGREIPTGAFVNHVNVSSTFGFDRGFESFFQDLDGENPHEVLRQAGEWIRDQQDSPFFAFVHLFAIHWPHTPSRLREDYHPQFDPNYDGPVRGVKIDVDRLMAERVTPQEKRDFEHLKALYDEDIFAVDSLVDQFLTTLSDDIDLDDVLLIITSDHGEAFKQHGYYGHGVSFNREELRVPLALRWPKGLQTARDVPGVVTTLDLAPTILGAFGLDNEDTEVESLELIGSNLIDIARGQVAIPERTLLSESSLSAGSLRFDRFALTTKDYKYIHLPEVERFEKTFGEALYDLRDDPDELRSLTELRPELLASFREQATTLGFRASDVFVLAFGPRSTPLRAQITVEGGIVAPETRRLRTIRDDSGNLLAPDWVKLPLEDQLFEKGAEVETITIEVAPGKRAHAVFFRGKGNDAVARIEGTTAEALFAEGRGPWPEEGVALGPLSERPLGWGDALAPDEVVLFRAKVRTHPSADLERLHIDDETRRILEATGYVQSADSNGDK